VALQAQHAAAVATSGGPTLDAVSAEFEDAGFLLSADSPRKRRPCTSAPVSDAKDEGRWNAHCDSPVCAVAWLRRRSTPRRTL
jgi:hypothetical protein